MTPIQQLLDGATSLTMDKQVPTSISISRGQKLRTQTRSISIYKFVVGLNPGLSYDNTTTRGLLQEYDTTGRLTEEQVKLSNVTGGSWICGYLGGLDAGDQTLTYMSGNTNANTMTVNVSDTANTSSSTVIVEKGDYIQATGHRYPYQATAQVLRGSGATVDIPLHRNLLTTTTGGNVLFGSDVTFRVKMVQQPPYSVTPGRYVEWGGDMQLMEVIT